MESEFLTNVLALLKQHAETGRLACRACGEPCRGLDLLSALPFCDDDCLSRHLTPLSRGGGRGGGGGRARSRSRNRQQRTRSSSGSEKATGRQSNKKTSSTRQQNSGQSHSSKSRSNKNNNRRGTRRRSSSQSRSSGRRRNNRRRSSSRQRDQQQQQQESTRSRSRGRRDRDQDSSQSSSSASQSRSRSRGSQSSSSRSGSQSRRGYRARNRRRGRGSNQQQQHQQQPYPTIRGGRNMIATGGGTVYWSRGYFGYGYGLWRAYHYPWFVDAFPLALWFPWPGWMPAYYVSDQQALERFDSQGGQAPPMQDNPQFAQLPRLPSFESLGIDIRRLDRFEGATLDANQRAVVDDMKQRLSTELDKLRAQYRQQAAQGFFPVPDMDAGRFEWVKVTVQNQQ